MRTKVLSTAILSALLLTSLFTGCTLQGQTSTTETDSTQQDNVSKISVSDEDIAVSEENTQTESLTNGLTTKFEPGFNLLKDESYGLLEMYANDSVYLFYFENAKLSEKLSDVLFGTDMQIEAVYTEFEPNEENSSFYKKVTDGLEKNGITMYGCVERNVQTLDGPVSVNDYNFRLCEASSINILDKNGSVLVKNVTDAKQLTGLDSSTDNNKDGTDESEDAENPENIDETEDIVE